MISQNFIDTSRVNFINIYTVKEYKTTSELRITKCENTLDQTFNWGKYILGRGYQSQFSGFIHNRSTCRREIWIGGIVKVTQPGNSIWIFFCRRARFDDNGRRAALWRRIVIMKTSIVRNHFFPDNAHHLFKQNSEIQPNQLHLVEANYLRWWNNFWWKWTPFCE